VQNHLWLYPNLVSARKATCSQKELSEQIGISQQEISRYERGEVKAPINYLKDVASVCHVSVDYLLGSEIPSESNLSAEEEKIIHILRALTPENQIRLSERAETLLELQQNETPCNK